jgi:predicted TIM-barrel fold metal-dependent hydrolase
LTVPRNRFLTTSGVLSLATLLSCGGDSQGDSSTPRALPASADHHLHIRTQAASEHIDRLEVALGEREAGQGEPSSPFTAEDALRALDAAGIEAGVVLSNAYMFSMPEAVAEDEAEQVRAENDYVATQVALHPTRLIGFCSVNPLREYALSEIERCADDDRIAGLKLHLTNSNVDLRAPADVATLASVFELADRLDLAIVIHMRTRATDYGAEDADIFIDEVLARTATVPVQIAHMAGWGGYDDGTDAALTAFAQALEEGRVSGERITFGLGAVVFQPEAAGADSALARQVRGNNERLAVQIRRLGVTRVVYATDWPSWPPVPDRVSGIQRNVELVRSALPLSGAELDQIASNVGPVFR